MFYGETGNILKLQKHSLLCGDLYVNCVFGVLFKDKAL